MTKASVLYAVCAPKWFLHRRLKLSDSHGFQNKVTSVDFSGAISGKSQHQDEPDVSFKSIIQVCQVNKMTTLAPSIPKRYKEILPDLQAQSYHQIVPPSLLIQDNRVVDGADRGDREELQEHNVKDKGEKVNITLDMVVRQKFLVSLWTPLPEQKTMSQ